jgi:predicted permease
MPDPRWSSKLGWAMPSRLRRDLFEPSWQDLYVSFITRRRRHSSRVALKALDAWLLARTMMLVLDCWRLGVTGAVSRRRAFMGATQSSDESTRERFIMILYHFRNAFRLLGRERSFTAAAVLTLALGVGANVAVFAVVEATLLHPLPYPESGRLVILNHRDKQTGLTKEFIAIGDYVDLVERQSSFESLSGYGTGQATLSGFGDPFRVSALMAGPGLLETLRVKPAMGRALVADDAREGAAPVLMLSYEFWQNRFGADPNIVGRGITHDGVKGQVVGIAPRGFRFPASSPTEVILPMSIPVQAPAARKSDWTFAVARLKPGVTLEQATIELRSISERLAEEYPRSNQSSEYFALSLRDALLGTTRPALLLMLAAVTVVLLIACANVANLLLARSMGRRREMAVRVALGAGRSRLVAQLLAESCTLALSAGVAGVLIAAWGSKALVAIIPKSVAVPGLADVGLDTGVLAFAVGISAATALGSGLVSALTVPTEMTAAALVSPGRVSAGARVRRAASLLVVAEIAFSIVLLIGAGLIIRSFSRLLAVDPGFRTDRVMTMEIQVPADRYRDPGPCRAFYDRAMAAIKGLPEVEEAGAAVVVPLTGNNWSVGFERAEFPVPAGEQPPEVGWQLASAGYFRTLGIPLRAGRLFDERDTPDTKPVVIISEAIERRFFPDEQPVGREIKLGKRKYEIAGVVGNIRRAELRDEPRADLYFPFEQTPGNSIALFVRTASEPAASLASLEAALRSTEPGITFGETRTMAEIARETIQVTHLALWLLGLFAGTALALAAVGIYGVMAYVVKQRTREIGTRVALGASRRDIVWLVMKQGAVIAAVGVAIGLGAGLSAARLLESMLYGVSPSDPATAAVAAAVLGSTMMAACYLPARRAALLDPARTLADQ